MTEEKIKELRKKFYKECSITLLSDPPQDKLKLTPNEQFQWIVDNVIKAKEEGYIPKCKECNDKFWIYDNEGGRTGCICHYDDTESEEEISEQCDICGLTDDHSLECPNNASPFASLIRDGYD